MLLVRWQFTCRSRSSARVFAFVPFDVVFTALGCHVYCFSITPCSDQIAPHTCCRAPRVLPRQKLAMDASRRHWTSQSRRSERNDKKRDREDDFDFEDFLEKKMHEARNYKEDNDRLRCDRKKDRQEIDRLRSDLRKNDAELVNLKQQWHPASPLPIPPTGCHPSRCHAILK